MNDNAEIMKFINRNEYRNWLINNHNQPNGIWIALIKGNKLFTANDALEESICFGWIDGLMKSIDEKTYIKYFSKRKDLAKWSVKNIAIYNTLLKSGLMTRDGIDAFKADVDDKKIVMDMDSKIEVIKTELMKHENVVSLFESKAPSRQKQFAGFYCDAKTDETRIKRINKILKL